MEGKTRHWSQLGVTRIKTFGSGSSAGQERMRPEVTVQYFKGEGGEQLYSDQLDSLERLDKLAADLGAAGIDTKPLADARPLFAQNLAKYTARRDWNG